ncbi:HAMP domain-containing histidine kinase [Myxococcota bacterium]|nr:HAMP domain-containing histidine kinase [Myxococcota bacterium]
MTDGREACAGAPGCSKIAHERRVIRELNAATAHDLANLLTVLESTVEILADGRTSSAERDEMRDAASEAIARATVLTRRLATWGRLDTAALHPQDLNVVAGELRASIAKLVGPRISVGVEVASEPAVIAAPRGALEQVIMNLVLNARDAIMGTGSITAAIRLREVAAETGDLSGARVVELSVRDDGCGIGEAVRAHLFEPFFTTKHTRGTGLGLVTVREIVERSGGRIEVQSAPGVGTTFVLSFPEHAPARDDQPPSDGTAVWPRGIAVRPG